MKIEETQGFRTENQTSEIGSQSLKDSSWSRQTSEKPKIVLAEIGKLFNDFGLNVCAIKEHRLNKKTGELEYAGKSPYHKWLHLKDTPLEEKEFQGYKFADCIGLGAVSGINDIRCIDFDKCQDLAFIQSFLKDLGLPENYEWLVRSGSKNGFHIWVKCNSFPANTTKADTYFHTSKTDKFDHLELRFNSFTVLPPSLHQSGNRYEFASGDIPKNPPSEISIDCITQAVEKIAFRRIEEKIEIKSTDFKKAFSTNGNRFESAIDFAEWIMSNKSQYSFIDGQKSNFRYNLANLLNKLGVNESDALSYILSNYPSSSPNTQRAESDCRSAYKSADRYNTLKFTPFSEWKAQQTDNKKFKSKQSEPDAPPADAAGENQEIEFNDELEIIKSKKNILNHNRVKAYLNGVFDFRKNVINDRIEYCQKSEKPNVWETINSDMCVTNFF